MPARSSLPPLLSCQLYYHLGREPRHLRTYAMGASGTRFPGSSFPNRSESFTENKCISTIRLGRTYLPATTRGFSSQQRFTFIPLPASKAQRFSHANLLRSEPKCCTAIRGLPCSQIAQSQSPKAVQNTQESGSILLIVISSPTHPRI